MTSRLCYSSWSSASDAFGLDAASKLQTFSFLIGVSGSLRILALKRLGPSKEICFAGSSVCSCSVSRYLAGSASRYCFSS